MSVYNAEQYIEKCIRSILNQTFREFECIVIDDASTDNTYKLLTSFDDRRLVIVKNEENKGLTKNLNYAIKLSQGNYIARMDADDICCYDRFQIQYNYMMSHPDVDVLGSNAYLIDENDNIVGTTLECYTNDNIQVKMQLLNPMLHPTVFMKSSIIKLFMYNEQYRTCQDFELWNRMGRQCKFANLSRETIFYRINKYGATRKAKNNIEVRISMLYDILRGYRRSKFLNLSESEMKALIALTLQQHPMDDYKVFNIYSRVSEPELNRIMAPSLIRFNWRILLKKGMFHVFFMGLVYWLIYCPNMYSVRYLNMSIRSKYRKSIE